MNRAMFSGVAGMKAHQTKMDVIGNNIANVNTYGYKAQRAVFSDIYYQTLRGASGGSSSRGGINPSSVGYGATLSAVQTQMSQSSMQNTGFGMDVAITGEGFLQVMDPDGNIFYTKAGMLDYDANGYLTDINGNFVLGSTDVDGKPGRQKIKLDNIGSVDAKQPADTQLINGIEFKVTASNASKYGNVAFNLGSSEALPAGQKAKAEISPTGGITVLLNAFESFSSMAELNSEINAAIVEANGGKALSSGTFTISANKNLFGSNASSGTYTGNAMQEEAGLKAGGDFFQGLDIKSFALAQNPKDQDYNFSLTYDQANNRYTIRANVEGEAYTADFSPDVSQGASIQMRGATSGKNITLEVKDKDALSGVLSGFAGDPTRTVTAKAQGSAPKYFLGGADIGVSSDFRGQGSLDFSGSTYDAATGKMTIVARDANGKVYTGEPVAPGERATLKTGADVDGVITVNLPNETTMKNHFGLPSGATAAELKAALEGSTGYHDFVAVSATSGKSEPLTGAQIAGGDFDIDSGTVTGSGANNIFGGLMAFMKTSNDFTGSGSVSSVTATYGGHATDNPWWEISMTVGGVDYKGSITKDTTASSILLKSANGDYLQMSNPGFEALGELYNDRKLTGDPELADNATVEGLTGGQTLDITPAQESKELGLSTVGFALVGGTEGGAITLDQLSSISIGADGTVTVNHAEKGTVSAGKISLATFSNPSGLQLVGNNYYTTSANSGEAKLADPGSGGTGALKSSALEMSNVDLSSEFADMITTQRGFQANSRIITVSDTMLEELINLKR